MENIPLQLLEQIYPLNELRQDLLESLVPGLRTRRYPGGELLFDFADSPADYFYVIEGAVTLSNRDRTTVSSIGPAAEQEAMPLPYMIPSPHRARTAVASKILLVDRAALLDAMRKNQASLRSVHGSQWDNLPPEDLRERARQRAIAQRAAPPPAAVTHPERILLVEDHPSDARIAQLMLDKLGYASDWVRNFPEAMSALEGKAYDIVLQDVQLPGVDGFEATRRIRARWPAGSPRIVAVTARSLKGDREACLAAGMDDYIAKPISIQLLAARLASASRAPAAPAEAPRFAAALQA